MDLGEKPAQCAGFSPKSALEREDGQPRSTGTVRPSASACLATTTVNSPGSFAHPPVASSQCWSARARTVTSAVSEAPASDTTTADPASHRCLLYTSDAADDLLCVDLGGRRIIKKKK